MKRTFDSKFKSQVALEALRGEKTIAEIAGGFPNPGGCFYYFEKFLSASNGLKISRTTLL